MFTVHILRACMVHTGSFAIAWPCCNCPTIVFPIAAKQHNRPWFADSNNLNGGILTVPRLVNDYYDIYTGHSYRPRVQFSKLINLIYGLAMSAFRSAALDTGARKCCCSIFCELHAWIIHADT